MYCEPSFNVRFKANTKSNSASGDKNGNYIHKTALIGPNVILGRNNYIGPYSIIGFPAEHKTFWGENMRPKFGKVIIGDNNIITSHVTIDAGTENITLVGNDCWILKGAYVGHDCNIEDNVTLSAHVLLGGHSIVMEGVNMGLGSMCHQRSIIGSYSMVGMGSVITKKSTILPFDTVIGKPARFLKRNIQKLSLFTDCQQLAEHNRFLQLVSQNH